jgi:predicted MFS family arabinose efflux permease
LQSNAKLHYFALMIIQKTKAATQAIFLVCGFGLSSWAPMVPYAKDRLDLNDSSLGLLLLFLGAGAIITMPVSGYLIHKLGSRKVMLASAIIIAVTLPLLLLMKSVVPMAAVLFIFGCGIGNIDVAMNAHGVQVQNLFGKPIMSSLHGLFSVGGLCGALGIGFLIKTGLEPLIAASCISILLLAIVLWQFKFLMDAKTEKEVIKRFSVDGTGQNGKKGSWLNGSVIFLGLMCFAVFLAEGAMLDWSAIFLRDDRGMDKALTGVGYASFSVAMAVMRLVGDRIVARLDSKFVVIYGALIGATGLAIAIFIPLIITALIGFILLGIGAANIVPVFFSAAGSLKNVSSSIAISAITTIGYAGQLAGPGILGFIAHRFSLPIALGFTGFLLLLVALSFYLKSKREVMN